MEQEEDKSNDSDDSDDSTDSDDSDPTVFKSRHKEEAHVVLCTYLLKIGLDAKKWWLPSSCLYNLEQYSFLHGSGRNIRWIFGGSCATD